jgi:methionine-rich copper-binding protein CopC
MEDALKIIVASAVTAFCTWVAGQIQKRKERKQTAAQLASANTTADTAERKANVATQIAGVANQTAHANSDLIKQLQEQIASQNGLILNFKITVDEMQQERASATVARQEERKLYDKKIKMLEAKCEQLEIQQQASLGQQAEILAGVDHVVEEWDELKVTLGGAQAELAADLDEAVAGLKKTVTRKRITGPLAGKSSDADDIKKKGKSNVGDH